MAKYYQTLTTMTAGLPVGYVLKREQIYWHGAAGVRNDINFSYVTRSGILFVCSDDSWRFAEANEKEYMMSLLKYGDKLAEHRDKIND